MNILIVNGRIYGFVELISSHTIPRNFIHLACDHKFFSNINSNFLLWVKGEPSKDWSLLDEDYKSINGQPLHIFGSLDPRVWFTPVSEQRFVECYVPGKLIRSTRGRINVGLEADDEFKNIFLSVFNYTNVNPIKIKNIDYRKEIINLSNIKSYRHIIKRVPAKVAFSHKKL